MKQAIPHSLFLYHMRAFSSDSGDREPGGDSYISGSTYQHAISRWHEELAAHGIEVRSDPHSGVVRLPLAGLVLTVDAMNTVSFN